MSRITIANINGKNHTVVWHDGGEPCYWLPSSQGLMGYGADFDRVQPEGLICTALPALPRYPNLRTEKDRIKHLREVSAYISAGIGINGTLAFNFSGADAFKQIESGYILETKEIIDIAIDEATDEQV